MAKYRISRKFSGVSLISAGFTQKNPDIIPLSFGYPSPDTFPIQELTEATAKALSLDGDNALQYPGGDGTRKLVEWIKDRSKQKSINVNNNNILVTTGSGQSIDLISRTFVDPGNSLWMESPSYFGAIRSFQLSGAKIDAFPLDENGLIVDEVEKALKQLRENNKDIP